MPREGSGTLARRLAGRTGRGRPELSRCPHLCWRRGLGILNPAKLWGGDGPHIVVNTMFMATECA